MDAADMEAREERRRNDSIVLELVQQSHADIRVVRDALQQRIDAEQHTIQQAIAHAISEAFPEGDLTGHRRAHEAAIHSSEKRAEFWDKMVFELFKYGLIGLCGWLIYAGWIKFLGGPPK